MKNQGINKIIALGHAGIQMDKIVAGIDDVDIAIGGHTHTFLYNGMLHIIAHSVMLHHIISFRFGSYHKI